jgi:predicted nucleotide-binding protein
MGWDTMNKKALRSKLLAAGFRVSEERRTGNNDGWRLDLDCGAIVNLFDTGNVSIQGTNTERVRQVIPTSHAPSQSPCLASKRRASITRVLLVGPQGTTRHKLEAILEDWGLEPVLLRQLGSGGQTVVEKVQQARQIATFAFVLVTPDHEGHKKRRLRQKAFRARQKIVLQLGLVLACFGRSTVAILIKSKPKMERPADIEGLLYVPFRNDVAEAKASLRKAMQAEGLTIAKKHCI